MHVAAHIFTKLIDCFSVADNKWKMTAQTVPDFGPEPMKPQIMGHVAVRPHGSAQMLRGQKNLDSEFEILPGYDLSTPRSLEDDIWSDDSDRAVETQHTSHCNVSSTDIQVCFIKLANSDQHSMLDSKLILNILMKKF